MESAPLFGPVETEVQRHLLRAAQLLLGAVIPPGHPWREAALDDLAAFTPGLVPSETVDRAALDAALRALRGNLGQAPEAALIAQGVTSEAHRVTGNALTAWVLAAALSRRRRFPADSVIASGLDAARRLKKITPEEMARLEPLHADPALIRARLRAAVQAPALEPKVAGYFTRIAELLETAETGRLPITRDRERMVPLDTYPRFDGEDYLEGGFAPEHVEIAGPIGLQSADRSPSEHLPVAPDDAENLAPRPAAAQRLAQVAKAAARRALATPAEYDPLTEHEVRSLVAACRAAPGDPVWQYLLAVLSYGEVMPRDPEEVPDALHVSGPDVEMRLLLTLPDLGSLVEDNPGERAIGDPGLADGLRLDPPEELRLGAELFRVEPAAVTAALISLRSALARPLSLGRIRASKRDWLRRAGTDPAIIGFLTGLDPSGRAQMHYTALEKSTLQTWHARYLAAIGLQPTGRPDETGIHGSRLRLPLELLELVFEETRAELRRHRVAAVASLAQVAAAHNAYLVHTLMLLNLATGHRPVGQPFEFLGDFGLDHGLLWISDKTGRAGRGTRVIALCPMAVAQTGHWLEHLRRLAARLSILRGDTVARHIHPALDIASDEAPLFFLLSERGDARALTARNQREAMEAILPTALNWHRHVLRGALADRYPGDVLDAFMGHAHLGEEGFGPASGLALGDLRRLAEGVEHLLARVGAKPVASPL